MPDRYVRGMSNKPWNLTPSAFVQGAGGGPPTTPANAYNWDPASTQFPNFRAAKAQVAAGKGRAIVTCSGDSTTAGFGGYVNPSAGTCTLTPYRDSGSWPFQMAQGLGSVGSSDNFIGSGGGVGIDARVSLVAGAVYSGAAAWGGNAISTTNSGDGVNFSPTLFFDHVRVILIAAGGAGAFNLTINNGPVLGTGTSNNSGNMQAFTFSVTRQSGVIVNVLQTGSTGIFLQSVECYDSTNPRINILNGGVGGLASNSFDTVSTGYTYISGALACTPSLYIFDIGINDGTTYSTSQATYQANLQNAIQIFQAANCDILGMVPTPVNGGNMETGPTFWLQYRTALFTLATQYNFPVIDLHSRYVSWAYQNSLGWECNGLHPDVLLYTDLGRFMATVLLAI